MPLIVPEVNADAIVGFRKRNIIANPNCSTAQLVVALKPLHDRARIKRVVVATYQSVSGAGKDAMDELFTQTRAVFVSDPVETRSSRSASPSTSSRRSTSSWRTASPARNGRWSSRPRRSSTRRSSWSRPACACRCSSRHSEAVAVEFENPITADEARDILREAPGLPGHRQARGRAATSRPIEAAGEDATYISRIREDPTVDNGLMLWIVSDNLRKGAALNAVQIAEVLVNRKLIQPKQLAA